MPSGPLHRCPQFPIVLQFPPLRSRPPLYGIQATKETVRQRDFCEGLGSTHMHVLGVVLAARAHGVAWYMHSMRTHNHSPIAQCPCHAENPIGCISVVLNALPALTMRASGSFASSPTPLSSSAFPFNIILNKYTPKCYQNAPGRASTRHLQTHTTLRMLDTVQLSQWAIWAWLLAGLATPMGS